MRLDVDEGKALLVDGPASVNLFSGSVTVLGANLEVGSKVVVRNGKRLPFEALSKATLELTLGETASFLEMDGSAIPKSWKDAADELLASKGFMSVLVIGGVDSGKTSLCTYLANRALREKRRVAVIDGDLGQSDIGPPATVGLARIVEPTVELFGVRAESVVFVGATTPSKAFDASLNALKTLKKKSLQMGTDFLIVNTDGWVEGEEAINYKDQVVELFTPNAIIALQKGDELEPLLKTVQGFRTFVAQLPENIRKRSHETRRALRELAYRKYLKKAKVQSYPLSWIRLRGASVGSFDTFSSEHGATNENSSQAPFVLYNELTSAIDGQDQNDLIVGLEDEKGEFLGIGILCSIDPQRRAMRIYTPVRKRAETIHVGQIRLDKNGKEFV